MSFNVKLLKTFFSNLREGLFSDGVKSDLTSPGFVSASKRIGRKEKKLVIMRLRLSPLAAAMLDLSAKVHSTTCCGAKIFNANNVKVARVFSELKIWPTFPYWRVTVDAHS